MSVTFSRIATTVGVLAVGACALTACNDSTTASAPIMTGAVTSTSVDASASSAEASKASASASVEAETGASKASVSPPSTLPDTKKESAPIPTPEGVKLSDKERAYLADLRRQKVEFMGDTDNNVALTMGQYVCSQRAAKTDPTMIRAYMLAAIGPIAKSESDAGTRADKVIAAADRNLC